MQSTAQLFERAVTHHQAGDVDRAIGLYRRVIRLDPKHADALHLLGVAAHQHRSHAEAVALISRAIEIAPPSPLLHSNLGAAYRDQGKLDDAIRCFRQAISMAPEFAGAHYNLAMALETQGDTDAAEDCYRETLRIDPSFAQAHNNLGKLYAAAGRFPEAETAFQAAIDADPALAEAFYNLGNTQQEIGQLKQAVDNYRAALNLAPHVSQIHNNLGTVLKQLEEHDQAAACFRTAVELAPDDAESLNNLGTVLQYQHRLDEACDCYQRAIRLYPEFSGAHANLGNVLADLGNIEAAIDCYDRALQFDPDYAEAGFNRALAMLRGGQLARGWSEYEWRWKRQVTPRCFDKPRWDGSPLEGRTLLIYAEQGIGDEIMFASCLPDVLSLPGRFIIECDPRLVPLFARSFPGARVVARPIASANQRRTDESMHNRTPEPAESDAAFHLQVAMGSLPHLLRRSLDSFPKRSRYLQADSRLRDKWRARYDAFGEGLVVGIAWRGGLDPDVARKRSTNLDQWKHVLAMPQRHFVNLQHGDCKHELNTFAEQTGITIHDWPDVKPLTDLENFAAQIAELDLVISVDNSTVHMAGALGVPVWTLLPLASDWRWMLDRDDSPWYPAMRLFRQDVWGDWSTVFDKVQQELCRELEDMALR